MSEVIDLREISNSIARKLITDPKFKQAFIAKPLEVLKAEGVPAEYIPAKAVVDVKALDTALEKAKGVRYRLGEPPVQSLVVACVVV